MKRIVLALMLISPFSFADWGDVYYCQMTTNSEISLEGKRTDYPLERFQFKLDKTKNAMVFGQGGWFDGAEDELREGMNFPAQEAWYTNSKYSMLYFEEGKFLHSNTGPNAVTISANCDKF